MSGDSPKFSIFPAAPGFSAEVNGHAQAILAWIVWHETQSVEPIFVPDWATRTPDGPNRALQDSVSRAPRRQRSETSLDGRLLEELADGVTKRSALQIKLLPHRAAEIDAALARQIMQGRIGAMKMRGVGRRGATVYFLPEHAPAGWTGHVGANPALPTLPIHAAPSIQS